MNHTHLLAIKFLKLARGGKTPMHPKEGLGLERLQCAHAFTESSHHSVRRPSPPPLTEGSKTAGTSRLSTATQVVSGMARI